MNFFKALFGGHEETAEELEQKKQDKNFDILKYDGVRALKTGQTDYAVRCFTEALKLKSDADTMNYLSQAYLQLNQPEQAYEILCRLSALLPEHTEVLLTQAHVAFLLKKYDETLAACRAVWQIDEKNATAHYHAAQAQQATGDIFNAIASVTQALTLQPDLEEGYRLRADIFQGMGQLKEAEADADYLLAHFPHTEDALLLKAGLRLNQGAPEEAIPYYIKVKELNPFNEKAYLLLSQSYAARRQMDQSLLILKEGLELLPQSAALYKEQGRIKLALGDKAGATDDLKKALALNPEEARRVEGQFTNLAQEMEARYKSQNPYGF